MKFSARFGELDRVPIAAANFDRADSGVVKEAEDWVAVISSVKKDGKADRRARQLRARLAHRHVLQPAAAARRAALCAGSAARRRQHRLPQHVCRLRDAARPS